MGKEIKRLLAHGITLAVLLNVAIVLALGLSYEALAAASVDPRLITTLSLIICGCAAIALPAARFKINMLNPGQSGTTNGALHVKRCAALAGCSTIGIVWIGIQGGSDFLTAAVGPAAILMEEVIFRGLPLVLIYRMAASRTTQIGIAIVFSLTFASLHLSPLAVMYADRLLFAVLAVLLAVHFRSIWPAFLYHLLSNITATSIAAPLHNDHQAWIYIPIDLAIFLLVFIMCSRTITKRIVSERTSVKL
ncbi:type II CAAX prenyl endopeptidase Rce1 family protein [Paenarthrobacter sp. NPDC092416]|uniref:CPBP family glutamic-type intramembrane protease n=1 Tax=Paenarthrobacter sp. NPDC092416 TaxID=3364386 RepID=UPI00381A699B